MATKIRRMAAFTALLQALRGSRGPGGAGVGTRLAAVPRMLAMGVSGRYPHLNTSRVVLAALALLYVVSPVDLVPEVILPLIGLGDDALVAAWLAGVVLSETDTFLAWEKAAAQAGVRVVSGEVVE